MHADLVVDDEFEARQADAGVGQLREFERQIRIADVHRDLDRDARHLAALAAGDFERQQPLEHAAGVALGAGNRHRLSVPQARGGVAATDYRGDAELARDDRRVAGAAAPVRHDGGRQLHDRLPVRVGHVGDQHVAWLDLRHLGGIRHHAHRAAADLVADRAAARQNAGAALEGVALFKVALARLHRLRPRLEDIQLAVGAVLGPLDVHRPSIVPLDGKRIARELQHFGVRERESRALLRAHFHHARRAARLGQSCKQHFFQLRAQSAPHDGRPALLQHRLVDVELVRIDRALDDHFAQAIRSGDEYHVPEAGFRVQGEHHPARTQIAAHHLLHGSRERHAAVVKAVMGTVGNGALVVERGIDPPDGLEDVVDAADVQKRLLLASERGFGQILRCSRGTHGK